jgi:ubiquinone/menaquinone biosynthesis C-methylase UbiE
MFSFLRRRKNSTLKLFEAGSGVSDIAEAESPAAHSPAVDASTVESSAAESEAAELVTVESLATESATTEFEAADLGAAESATIDPAAVEPATAEPPAEAAPAEIETVSETASAENPVEELIAVEDPVKAEESVAVEESPSSESPTTKAGVADDPSAESIAVEQPVAVEEFISSEEPVAFNELPPAESTSANGPPDEVLAADLPVAESDGGIFPLESVALDVAEIESPAVASAAPGATEIESTPAEPTCAEAPNAESQPVVPIAPDVVDPAPPAGVPSPEKARATLSKPKRRWWTFWRNPHSAEEPATAEQSGVAETAPSESIHGDLQPIEPVAAELPHAVVASVGEKVSESPAAEESMVAEERPTEDLAADMSCAAENATENSLIAPVAPDVVEIESATVASLAPDVAEIGSTTVERLAEEVPILAETSESPATEDLATKSVTGEEFAPFETTAAEAQAAEIEGIPPVPDDPNIESVAVEESLASEDPAALENAVADAATAETENLPLPADIFTGEPPIGAEAASAEVFAPDGETLVVPDETPVLVSETREEHHSGGVGESSSGPSDSGLLDLPRVAEPEVMDDSEEVEAYTCAAAQEWLDKIDNSFVEHAARLVQGRKRGRAADIGTGPGQIALKLAIRLSLWKIIGVDRSQKMIDEALSHLAATPAVTGRLEFHIADGNRLDFPDATFDLVICNSVLHHFAEPKNLLAELARVAKPGGAILLRDLRRPSRLQYPFHVRWHGRKYSGAMRKLYQDSVRAAYTVPELQRLLDASPLRGARVFRHGSTHIGLERPYRR